MIRYLLDERLPPVEALSCRHPKLARLANSGPWTVTETGSGMALTRGKADTWTDAKPGIDGLRYQLADPLPAFDLAAFLRPGATGNPVRLRCGITIPIALAVVTDGLLIGLDGKLGEPAGDYARLALSLFDRTEDPNAVISSTDPDLIAFARLAIQSCTTLTVELIHAYRMLGSADLQPLFEAATGLPKAAAGGAG